MLVYVVTKVEDQNCDVTLEGVFYRGEDACKRCLQLWDEWVMGLDEGELNGASWVELGEGHWEMEIDKEGYNHIRRAKDWSWVVVGNYRWAVDELEVK